MLLISTFINVANCTTSATPTLLCSIDTFRLHPDSGSIYSGSTLMTLRRVDSNPSHRFRSAALTPFGSTPMTLCHVDSGPWYLTPVSHTPATPTSSATMTKHSGGSTMTSPLMIRETTSIRFCHRDLAIMRLHHRNNFATRCSDT
jgi:hypothetical protein